MKKFTIIMLIIIIGLGTILIVKTKSSKELTRESVIQLLEKGETCNNYYCEKTTNYYDVNTIRKIKGNKMLITAEGITEYINYDTKEVLVISEKSKTAMKTTIDSNKLMLPDKIYYSSYLEFIKNNENAYKYLGTEKIDEFNCIKIEIEIKKEKYNFWIDQETGLLIKLKSESEETKTSVEENYKIKLNCVTDEDLKVPDLSGYKVSQ